MKAFLLKYRVVDILTLCIAIGVFLALYGNVPALFAGVSVAQVLVIVLIVMVGGFGAIAGCVAGVALSKSPSEDYRRFGKLMMTVSIVMLVLNFLCCAVGTGMGLFSNLLYY